jgi:hypothetical protein
MTGTMDDGLRLLTYERSVDSTARHDNSATVQEIKKECERMFAYLDLFFKKKLAMLEYANLAGVRLRARTR